MKRLLLSALGCTVALCITACSNQVTRVSLEKVQNQIWLLSKIDGQPVTGDASLELSSDERAAGNTGCNRFFGLAVMEDNQFLVERMGMTRMVCLDDNSSTIEPLVVDVLTHHSELAMQGETLILKGKRHTLTYRLNAQ